MVRTNGFRQFLILLYKGLLVRKRHYIVTFFEIVIPIFIASIPCIIESEMSSPQTNYFDFRNTKTVMSNYTTFKPFDPFYSTSNSRYDMQFLFTPSNALTDKFMNDSIKMFQSKTNYKGSITSKGLKSEKELVNDSLYKKKPLPH
ncbi:ATP-binding cassette sub-family A member 3 [Caerostris extrusa]|uniref:ATP-binding cassette sub-family A member 3 n=1 Tax=Caerostris extrusa TaxID=172846 RepID=A0AAV4NQY6_CAEEX|nr:ATP-binding cassette sub-family A member 3 [Caerostris extrusa]